MTALKNRSRQSGVALITILLIVAIAVVLGVTMTKQQHFAIKSARTNFDQTIARQYAYGGEVLARQILHKDYVDNPTGPDDLSEAWAQPDMKFEFDDGDGEVTFQIEDLQGRFNINSVSVAGTGAGNTFAREVLNRLLSGQNVNPNYYKRIVDWVDGDDTSSNSRGGGIGAEDIDYLGLERPYRAANQFVGDISELLLILEMDSKQYEIMKLYLISLPKIDSKLNVNTMTMEQMLALGTSVNPADAEGIIEDRGRNLNFTTVLDFLAKLGLPPTIQNELDIKSEFFQVEIRARYQDRYAYLTSVIHRNPTDGTMRVIYRNQSKVILLD